ncbi:putative ribonuclease H-like domain-containing protein, partial [Tanacetum coccineum]
PYKAGLESVEARLDKKNEVVFEEDIKILKLDIKLRDNALTELRKKFEKAEKERDDLKLTLEKFGNSSKNLSKLLEIQVSDKIKTQVSDKIKTGVGFDSQVVDSHVFDSQENKRYKISEGYHAVPPPYTGNFMPSKYDLVLADEGEYIFSKSVTSIPDVATREAKTSVSKPKSVGEPFIEDWISNSEDENKTEFKSKQRKLSFVKTEFVKSNKHVKTPRESVKKVENKKQAKYPRKNSQSPRGNQRSWNNLMTQKLGSNFEFKNKACYECGSFNHLIKDCDLYEKKMVEKIVWNNARRTNHQNSQRMTHRHPKENFVPKAVLMKSGIKTLNTAGQNFSKAAVSINTTRPINTAYPRPTVNSARTTSNVFNRAHSHVRRPFNKSITNKNNNLNEKVNTIKGNVTTARPKVVVSDNKGNEANAVKASACWVWRPKQNVLDHVSRHNGASMNFKRSDYVDAQGRSKKKGVIDSGCSRHMTGNKSYLSDYEEINGGFVAFGGDPKWGRIIGKGKISTGSKDSLDDGFKPSGEEEKKDFEDPENEDGEVPKDNVAHENIVYGCDDDPNMPNLEKIAYSDDDEDVGAEADMNNLNTFIHVSPIPTTRLHKDYPIEQIIGDIHSAPQTRRMIKSVTEHVEPKKVIQALTDPSWIEAMQDELLYNKKDDRGIVVRKKARSVSTGLHSEKLLEPDDIIFGFTKKSLCTEFEQMMHKRFQMSSIGELTFFLGLQVKQKDDGIFISQDKYVADILNKFDFATVKTASTPMETNKALLEDEEATNVDVHLYRSRVGSFMYLIASRPDIMFVVYACARFQVTPKTSHLHAVERIFRYLKGHPKLGLWYSRDSPFDLEAFSNCDYASASLKRKSTTGGCQFLRRRLISWQCKKQIIVTNSTTKAEYVVVANYCGQVLWIQNQLLDYGYNFMNTKIFIDNESTICIVKNPVFHSKTKHIKIRHHFIRDSYEKRLIQVIKIYANHNVADLLTKAFDVSRFQYLIARCLEWNGTAAKDEIQVSVVRVTYYCGPIPLVTDETVIKEWEDRMERAVTTASSLQVEQDSVLWKYALTVNPTVYESCIKQFWATAKAKTVNGERQIQALVDKKKVIITKKSLLLLDSIHAHYSQPSSSKPQKKKSRRKQRKDSGPTEPIPDEATNEEPISTPSCDLPQSAKTAQAKEIASLKKRVKQLEKRRKSRTSGLKRLRKVGSASRVESSNDVSLGVRSCILKGRKIVDLDVDEELMLLRLQAHFQFRAMMTYYVSEVVTTTSATTTIDELTLAQTLIKIKAAKPKAVKTAATTITTVVASIRPKAKVIVFHDQEEQAPAFTPIVSYSKASQLP